MKRENLKLFIRLYTPKSVLHLGDDQKTVRWHCLKTIASNEEVLTENELSVARKILYRVERIYQISFPEEEAKYISLHIMSKGSKQQEATKECDLSHRVSQILGKIEDGFWISNVGQIVNYCMDLLPIYNR